MKKILFVVCAFVCLGMASCTCCKNKQCQGQQDTVYLYDTTVIETTDTVYAN